MLEFDKLVAQLGSVDQKQASRARQSLLQLTGRVMSSGKPVLRQEVAQTLLRELTTPQSTGDQPKHPATVRNEMAGLLSQVAGETEIAPFTRALEDVQTREMAKWALDRITSPCAIAVLIDAALKGAGREFRIDAIRALARRAGCKVVEALKKCAADKDVAIRGAALDALSNQPEVSVDKLLLAELQRCDDERLSRRLWKARYRLAETLVKSGQREAGKQLFRILRETASDELLSLSAKVALERLA